MAPSHEPGQLAPVMAGLCRGEDPLPDHLSDGVKLGVIVGRSVAGRVRIDPRRALCIEVFDGLQAPCALWLVVPDVEQNGCQLMGWGGHRQELDPALVAFIRRTNRQESPPPEVRSLGEGLEQTIDHDQPDFWIGCAEGWFEPVTLHWKLSKLLEGFDAGIRAHVRFHADDQLPFPPVCCDFYGLSAQSCDELLVAVLSGEFCCGGAKLGGTSGHGA